MKTILFILFIFFILAPKNAYTEPRIIKKISEIENFAFDFEQLINNKKETGNCIISFNNKMICKYDESEKLIVSNGKTLLIKSKNSNFANTYKTENTYFKYFLNKEFLVSKIKGNVIEKEKNFLLSIKDQSNELNIFFDKNNYLIKGWETIDLYGNKVRSNIIVNNINQVLSDNIFNFNHYN
tara:strand:- start:267 stop:812 length:546 start_codon:yes stop_codon:yes gene_type:complete